MSSSETTIRQVGQQDLDTFQQRIVQIFLDAFTIDGFAFNAQRATEEKAVGYLQSLFAHGPVAFFAFDSGRVASPCYPIAFLCGLSHSSPCRARVYLHAGRGGYPKWTASGPGVGRRCGKWDP